MSVNPSKSVNIRGDFALLLGPVVDHEYEVLTDEEEEESTVPNKSATLRQDTTALQEQQQKKQQNKVEKW